MAVKQQLWTISGLSVELQRNQKLIAQGAGESSGRRQGPGE